MKVKFGFIQLVGVMAVVSPALLVANETEKPGVDTTVTLLPGQAPPVAEAVPAVERAPLEENAGEKGKAESKPKEASGPPEKLVADFSEQDKALADRVEERWKAMVERDFKSAYSFALPSFRQATTLEQFSNRFGKAVAWRKAQVRGIRYDSPEIARVKIALETELTTPWGGKPEVRVTRIDETWLKRDGIWWLNPN